MPGKTVHRWFTDTQTVLWIGIFSLVMLLASCDNSVIYQEYKEMDSDGWSKERKIDFEFNVQDTSSINNLFIQIRNKGNYPYSNLYLFVNMNGPGGQVLQDTINIILADKRGKWLGKGVGDLWDLSVPYIRNFKFAQQGLYKFTYEQGMRVDDKLTGIADVGLCIEKSDRE